MLAGIPLVISGIRQDGVYFDAVQDTENSKTVSLISGDSSLLTNNIQKGRITISSTRIGDLGGRADQNGLIMTGDLIAYCDTLRLLSDSIGSIITVQYNRGNSTDLFVFTGCGLVSCKPLTLAGNDVAFYDTVFTYSRYSRVSM